MFTHISLYIYIYESTKIVYAYINIYGQCFLKNVGVYIQIFICIYIIIAYIYIYICDLYIYIYIYIDVYTSNIYDIYIYIFTRIHRICLFEAG